MLISQAKHRNTVPLIRWLIFIIFLCAIMALILVLFRIKPNIISSLERIISHPGNDSWKPMIDALNLLKGNPNQPVYDILFQQGIKFQYPLSSLLIFDLPERILGISYIQMSFLLDRMSAICVPIFGFISAKILIGTLRKNQIQQISFRSKFEIRLTYLLVFILAFLFYPIIRSYSLGQIQTILTVLTALAMLCWQHDKKVLVGLIFGMICIIKPQLGLVLVWGAIRKQWKMVLAGMSVIGIFSIISIAFYGLDNNLQYLNVLSFLSRHGEAFYANQSINGLLNRFLFNGDNLTWDGTFPGYNPTVHIITLVTSLFFILGGLLWRYRNRNPDIIELSIIILCTTIASPIAWEHHYAILFTIFLLLSPYMYIFYGGTKGKIILFAVSYLLVSHHFEFAKLFAETKLNIVQSYLFFGALVILYFLFSVSKKIKTITMKKDYSS